VTDANLSEKAAAAVESTADAVKGAASTATASVEKAPDTAAADATKAAESAKAATAKAAGEVKAEASKAADATKATATKAADSAKATATGAKATVDKAVAGKAGQAKDASKDVPPPRSAAQIEADLDVVRARLAGRIDDLEDYVAPKNVAKRGVDSVKRVFVDEYGGVKPDRVLMAVGAVVLLVGLRAVGRRRRNR
jgi:hypothetical protein